MENRCAALLILVIAHFSFNNVFAQGTTLITVVSKVEQAPLAGATIQPLNNPDEKGWVADAEGRVIITLGDPMHVVISFAGYLDNTQVIVPGQDIVISMEEDVLGLDEVVVTGSFVPTTSARSLYTVNKLDATFIESRGAVNLSDVIQTQLNLKTIQDDVLGTRLVMQGISGPNVKMLVDGVPLVNGTGGEFDLTQINMNNVERIEIVEGPLSVQYGTNALAGTINVITKTYSEDEFVLNTSGYYETVGQYNFDLSLAKGWKNTSLTIGGARNQFDGYSSTGERNENWIPKTQYLANVKLKTSVKWLNISGSLDKLWQESVGHGNASSAFNNRTGKISEIAADNYFHTDRLNGAINIDGLIAKRHYLNLVNGVSTFEQGSRRFMQDVIDDDRWLSLDEDDHDTTRFTTWTYRGTYVYGDQKNDQGVFLTSGYEISLNSASGGRISADAKGKVNEYALFMAAEFPVGSRIKVQPALRYTYSNSYDTRKIDFLNAGLPLLPSLNVMYSNGQKFDIRFSYGQGFRTPSVRELYYEFIDANHYIVGNSELEPEVGNNINASATWRGKLGKTVAAITPSVFFSRIENKIDLIQIIDRSTLPDEVPKNVPVAREYANIPNFKSYGANVSAELSFPAGVRVSPGIGILARSGSEADDQFYTSYEANLNASYFLKGIDTRFNIFYKYNGRISEFARNQDGSIGVLTLDNYNTMDLSLSRPFLKGSLFTTVGVKNVFNVTDIGIDGDGSKGLVLQTGREAFYPISWGRTLFIKIQYSIN